MESPAAEIRRRLGPAPRLKRAPLVSIVVVNRDGAPHLRRLLAGLEAHTDYPSLELILVDNASGDESLDLVRAAEARFPITILANPHNESFSDACNQGSEAARGELLLFLNNDIEPFELGWLRELVACGLQEGVGIAGATLIQPREGRPGGYAVQHRAMRLRDEGGLLRADLHGRGDDPLGPGLGEDADTPIAAGACMLIERGLFQQVGGFTHGFFYGGEDIDLGLKVLEQGRRVVCSGRSLLIHRLGSTRAKTSAERQAEIGRGNRRLLAERWGLRLRREYELDRLDDTGFWSAPGLGPADGGPSREEALALGFCLKSSEPAAAGERDPLCRLRAELRRRGHRCVVLRGERVEDLAGFDHDVAVHVRGPARYLPRPSQLNVLWTIGDLDAPAPIERSRYDLVVTSKDVKSLIEAVLARAEQLGLPKRLRAASA
jgi:GT2 family glycosyltransferase